MLVTEFQKEEKVRKILEDRLGVKLEKKKVSLLGTNEEWEADFVSEDGSIVGDVKSAQYKGGQPGTALGRYLSTPYIFLSHAVGAKRKLLVCTEKSLYDLFLRSRLGQIAQYEGIEIKYVDLNVTASTTK